MRNGTERRPLSPAAVHEISQRAMGFGSSFPLIVAHASAHAALNGAEIFAPSAVRNYWFLFGCVVKLSLLFAGAMLAFLLGQPLFGNLQWCLRDFWLGSLPACRCLPSSSGCCTPRCLRSSGSASFSSPRADHFRAVGNLATGGHLATGRRVRGGVFS
jgi:hypothetical protein